MRRTVRRMTTAPQTPDWQVRLGTLGGIVDGVEDLEQCLRVVVLTPKGSVPHDPEFGADIYRYLDRPLAAVRGAIVREVIEAVRYGEPRVQLLSVALSPDDAATGTIALTLEWTVPGLAGTQQSAFLVGAAA